MNSQLLRNVILPLILIALGYTGVKFLSDFAEAARPALPQGYEDSDLSINGSSFRGFALGSEGLMADWYWMRSLQYLGDKVSKSESEIVNIDDLRDLNPRLLYPLLENAIDLDPHFIAPYTYGAIVMPAIDPAKAIAIAQKGIDNNPTEWRLYQHLAYIYWKLKRYDKAAEIYDEGSRIAGAAPFMRLMAASMRSEGGSRETARLIYRQMVADADDQMTKDSAQAHLDMLDSQEDLEQINKALEEFKDRNGSCPNTFTEIFPLLAKIKLSKGRDLKIDNADRLLDPTGVPYLLNREKCHGAVDKNNSRLPRSE